MRVPEPSMRDVAGRAHVSLGTVSNVLNRPELVSERTRQRVLEAIADLGFVPNESGRTLRRGRSRTLAYVVLDAGNPFFTDVARGVRDTAEAAALTVFLCDSGEDPRRQAHYLDLLEQQRVEGVLLTPVDVDDERLTLLPRRGTPVVLVDRGASTRDRPDGETAFATGDESSAEHCSVTVDDVRGGGLAAAHVAQIGHPCVAFVGGPVRLAQVADRLAGVRAALAGTGIELVELMMDALTVAEGRRAGERLAALPAAHRPTAAVCANDLLALGVLQQAVRLGLRVPDDLAIVGYDDIEFAEAAAVPLTTVAQPRHLLGRTAAELLIEEARREPDHRHRQVVFTPELVVRASTAARPQS